jgi:DNA modification methylase
MRRLIAEGVKVQCVVSSPPYWRQRDYGMGGQLGLEETPESYVAAMVDVFRLVRDILTDDGILWLNLGDKWASGGNGGGGSLMEERAEAWAHVKEYKGWRSPPIGYKDKDLVGIPWMTAFALRADGWYLRQCNIWAKKNGMSESVTDRSTVAHEYVFQLTKNNDYYYNSEAARTPLAPSSETRLAQNVEAQAGSDRANGGRKTNGPMKAVSKKGNPRSVAASAHGIDERKHGDYGSANLRSVWWLSTANSGDGHFAVMPSRLAEICIVAGSRPGDIVFDPFMGSGTTGEVAQRLGRQWLGIELNPEYAKLAEARTSGTIGMALA